MDLACGEALGAKMAVAYGSWWSHVSTPPHPSTFCTYLGLPGPVGLRRSHAWYPHRALQASVLHHQAVMSQPGDLAQRPIVCGKGAGYGCGGGVWDLEDPGKPPFPLPKLAYEVIRNILNHFRGPDQESKPARSALDSGVRNEVSPSPKIYICVYF